MHGAKDDDDRLRQAFRRLREEETHAIPAFEHVLSRQRTRRPLSHGVRAVRLVGAAAVILLLAFGGLRLVQFARPDGATGALAVELQRTSAVWHSPTDFLLERSAAPVWRGVPRIGGPLRAVVPADPAAPDRTEDMGRDSPGRTPS